MYSPGYRRVLQWFFSVDGLSGLAWYHQLYWFYRSCFLMIGVFVLNPRFHFPYHCYKKFIFSVPVAFTRQASTSSPCCTFYFLLLLSSFFFPSFFACFAQWPPTSNQLCTEAKIHLLLDQICPYYYVNNFLSPCECSMNQPLSVWGWIISHDEYSGQQTSKESRHAVQVIYTTCVVGTKFVVQHRLK